MGRMKCTTCHLPMHACASAPKAVALMVECRNAYQHRGARGRGAGSSHQGRCDVRGPRGGVTCMWTTFPCVQQAPVDCVMRLWSSWNAPGSVAVACGRFGGSVGLVWG